MKTIMAIFISFLFLGPVQGQKHTMTTTSSSTSCNTSEDNDSYTVNAKYTKDFFKELLTVISNELGEPSYENGTRYEWEDDSSLYEFRLRKGRFSIELRKGDMAPNAFEKYKRLAEKCASIISDNHNEHHNSAYQKLQEENKNN